MAWFYAAIHWAIEPLLQTLILACPRLSFAVNAYAGREGIPTVLRDRLWVASVGLPLHRSTGLGRLSAG